MGLIVTSMAQTVEHYFMQFNTKPRVESRKSPIQVNKLDYILPFILYTNKHKIKLNQVFISIRKLF